jgi:hypothetical protein
LFLILSLHFFPFKKPIIATQNPTIAAHQVLISILKQSASIYPVVAQIKITREFPESKDAAQAGLAPDGSERKADLTPERAHAILKNVSDDQCRAIGLNPGMWMGVVKTHERAQGCCLSDF